MPILVDTSAIFALADRASSAHDDVNAILQSAREQILIPITVLPEVDYLITTRLGVKVAIAVLESIVQGDLPVEHLTGSDVQRSLEIVRKYVGSDIGFVDASIVAVAERLRVDRVLTLDHRHFAMLRPAHRTAFELLP